MILRCRPTAELWLAAALLASIVVTPVDASEALVKEWEKCTRVCKAAAGNRMALDGGAAGSFTVQCWMRKQNDGVLRILDAHGVALVAYQPCYYGAGKSDRPLYLSKPTREKYRLEFKNPKRTDGRRVFLEVALVGDS